MRPRVALIFVFLVLTGCVSSHVVDSWHDPAFIGAIRFKKTLVIALTTDKLAARAAEDEMVSRLGEGRSVQAYKLLTAEDRADSAHLKPCLEKNGVDGVIVFRPVSTRPPDVTTENWPPGSGRYPYDPFWSFYDRAWESASQPDYLGDEPSIRVQTNVYRLRDAKLIWTGLSDAFNRSDFKNVAGGIGRAVEKQLVKEELLQ